MSASRDCPGSESWQALLDDNVPADQRESYEKHLEGCAACQERLSEVEEGGDVLLHLARQSGDPTEVPLDPTLVQVLDRLHDWKSPVRTDPGEPADLYFLQSADRPDLLGTLGNYEVQAVIGQGGMGVVLKAYEPALHRLVAIKVMAAAVAGSATARKRFTREAQAAAVCHDNIVTVHGVHETDGLPYLVMQYVAGESLQDRLDRTGPLELAEIVRIGFQTAAGLAAAHAQGLIHRDIKPANLLLENGLARVKITDFGLARMADDVGLTQAGVVAGTPEFMAPEQARAEAVDHRADLFSLGSVLYAMCTGEPPFRGATSLAVLREVSEQQQKPIRSLNPHIPGWLEALVERLMVKDPAGRFQSAAEVAALLEGYLAHLRQPEAAPAPQFSSAPPAKLRKSEHAPPGQGPRYSLVAAAAAGFLVCLLLGLLGIFPLLFGGGNPEASKQSNHFHWDFSNGQLDERLFRYVGAREQIKLEREGLRITLPGNNARPPETGVLARFRVKGDFEVTAAYELLNLDAPLRPRGVGRVSLYLKTDTKTANATLLAHQSNRAYVYSKATFDPDGKRQFIGDGKTANGTFGKLRIARTGSVVKFLVAEGNSDTFRELPWVEEQPCELDAEEVVALRVAAENGRTDTPTDVRIYYLDIWSPQSFADDGSPLFPERDWTSGLGNWLPALIIGGVFLSILGIGAGLMWLRGRERRRAKNGKLHG